MNDPADDREDAADAVDTDDVVDTGDSAGTDDAVDTDDAAGTGDSSRATDDAGTERPDEPDQTVGELVEYCRLQAGVLTGRVETMTEEATDRIDEIDEEIATLRADLEAADRDDADTVGGDEDGIEAGSGDEDGIEIGSGGDDEGTASSVAEAESDLRRKQAMVEATESRIRLFQELSTAYLELAEELIESLESGEADSDDAVSRVVSFEVERDAPAYFEERETLAEVAAASGED